MSGWVEKCHVNLIGSRCGGNTARPQQHVRLSPAVEPHGLREAKSRDTLKGSSTVAWHRVTAGLHAYMGPLVFYHPLVEAKTHVLSVSGWGGLSTANTETGPPRHTAACQARFGEGSKCVG